MAKVQHTEGDKAPKFDTLDVSGKKIRLSDYKKKSVLLVFFRYAGCPWCNLAIHRLALEYPMLQEQNCEVIAFVQSDQASIQKNILARHALKPRFTIIADPRKQFYDLYGVQTSHVAAVRSIRQIPQWVHAVKEHGFKQEEIDGDLFLVPAAFLIAKQTQKIVKADYGTNFYAFESFLNIYESLVFNDA